MPVARITGQGLAAIALAVSLLWASVLAERKANAQARAERARVIRDLDRMMQHRQHTQPVWTPRPRAGRPVAG